MVQVGPGGPGAWGFALTAEREAAGRRPAWSKILRSSPVVSETLALESNHSWNPSWSLVSDE